MVYNFSKFGFTFQQCVCEKFGIIPDSKAAISSFQASYEPKLRSLFLPVIDRIFEEIGHKPIECTTLTKFQGRPVPFNFILDNNSSVSVRTNHHGDKIAPRNVGQAGFEKLNEYFENIYGKKICSQNDIKKLIYYRIDEALPIFLKNLFDADYIIWVYFENNEIKYQIIPGDDFIDLEFEKPYFSFTRDFDTWTESTTLKYKGDSIAEIQVHKNRTFKFRFIMKSLLNYVKARETTTETLGITAEKAICDYFGLKFPSNFIKRASPQMERALMPVIKKSFAVLPRAIEHTGSFTGVRGGESKCPYDFKLEGNQTLSLKTNIGKMVCPPEVGQPNSDTCYLYFKQFIDSDHIDKSIFKNMVFEHIEEMIPIYLNHMFDSDYLLRIYSRDGKYKDFDYEIVKQNHGCEIEWNRSDFSFSKKSVEDWNESNTVYYKNISLGEFQIHNNRNCYKFRFNFNHLLQLINDYMKKTN